MKKIVLLIFLPFLLYAQDGITINIVNRSIVIDHRTNYSHVEVDSNISIYNKYCGKYSKQDTFIYTIERVETEKNIITTIPSIHNKSCLLHEQLKNKSVYERDSMLNLFTSTLFKMKPVRGHVVLAYRVSSVNYYLGKYPYIDIHKTYFERYDNRKWYTSKATRVFMIDNLFYYIHMENNDLEYARSARRSRKAVCCDFKRLVENVKIIEKEPISLPKNNN
jgi:hypothetical protein